MEVKIEIDDSCKHCKKGLAYFKLLHKQNKNNYMGIKLLPFVKKDEDLVKRIITPIVLRPNYNSAGHLTHFHIEKQQ